ncbi:MAG TPA: hypothetical protein VMH02_12300 [Verrucomicrobiae bacterium]|nr:hypothetical protein [Verrucomicrobiae bacterium]
MPFGLRYNRGVAAIAAFVVFLSAFPARGDAPSSDDVATQALDLINHQSCAGSFKDVVAQLPPPASPAPGASPTPQATPPLPGMPGGVGNGTYQLYATPRPRPGSQVTPPPVPTPTPNAGGSPVPIFLVRGGETPPPIPPAGQPSPTPSPEPTGVPTLGPGFIAVISDKVEGNSHRGQPGDAIGNVHIFYSQEELVGDRAHYDGLRTVTVTGHPFLIDHQHDSILTADEIIFDTIQQTAKLVNGKGESDQGVERGYIHFKADDLHTDPDGTAHGLNPYLTTCDNPRGGYHITGKSIDVVPGDKIVINKAVLWLGAAAVFYIPKLIIPLRTVDNQREVSRWFPEVGYDSYEGAWIKIRVPFGKDQHYYGYYIVNYFTKEGLGLGYVGFYSAKNGRRTVSVNLYGINDRLSDSKEYNLTVAEQENFSQHLRGAFNFGYQSNYGPLENIPPNETLSAQIEHQTANTSQNYSFNHSGVGSQSSSDSYAFTDARQFNQWLNQAVSLSFSDSSSTFGTESSSTHQAVFDYLLHYTTAGADYQMEYNKTYTDQPYGVDKVPEFTVRPYDFFQHFIIPLSAQLTAGEYSEPSNLFATWRGDAGLVLGPVLAKVFGSDFQASVDVDQYAYGTGDLKAAIQQQASLTTPIGTHVVNSLTYNEANYNGPALVPFQYLDQQPTTNTKNAQDLLRLFNDDIYTFSLGYSTNFNGMAQPVTYQIAARPSARSVVLLSGSFIPGPGQGFDSTNLQLSTPFGRGSQLQFVTTLNWHGPGEVVADKLLYYTRTIGDCYQVQVLYSEASRTISMGLDLLSFPSQQAAFSFGQAGPIVPTTFNF